MVDLLWSFSPWLTFIVVERFASLDDAVACAVTVGIIVLGRAVYHHHVHMLDVVSLVYFLGLGAVVLATSSESQTDISNYAQFGAHLALTVIVFGSIVLGHPFTESYPRQRVPRERWDSPEFHAVNRKISAAWGLAFLVGSISLLIAANTDEVPVLLRIIIPLGALYWAYNFTETHSSRAVTSAAAPPS